MSNPVSDQVEEIADRVREELSEEEVQQLEEFLSSVPEEYLDVPAKLNAAKIQENLLPASKDIRFEPDDLSPIEVAWDPTNFQLKVVDGREVELEEEKQEYVFADEDRGENPQ